MEQRPKISQIFKYTKICDDNPSCIFSSATRVQQEQEHYGSECVRRDRTGESGPACVWALRQEVAAVRPGYGPWNIPVVTNLQPGHHLPEPGQSCVLWQGCASYSNFANKISTAVIWRSLLNIPRSRPIDLPCCSSKKVPSMDENGAPQSLNFVYVG